MDRQWENCELYFIIFWIAVLGGDLRHKSVLRACLWQLLIHWLRVRKTKCRTLASGRGISTGKKASTRLKVLARFSQLFAFVRLNQGFNLLLYLIQVE